MTAAELINDLRRRGVRLIAAGDRLGWQAPSGTVSASDLGVLRERKAEVLATLREPAVDWVALYKERVAEAYLEIAVEWCMAHPEVDVLPSAEAEPIVVAELAKLGISDPRRTEEEACPVGRG